MPEHQTLPIILILLATAVVIVAIFRKLKVSPILGYLFAGAIIGPGGIAIIKDVNGTSAIAEFGVVFLLFIIGLELSWERLKIVRKQAFALGLLQVLVTTVVIATILHRFDFSTPTAIIIAGGLSLSSTAFVMQLLGEYNQKNAQIGRVTLAVLLIQDLAVVPLLVLIPALANPQASVGMEILTVILKAIAALSLIAILGHFLLRPLYRIIASLQNPEIFSALTLFLILGTSWLTYITGLSLALGAFMAGLLMAETEYRHQIEADVMPYKGLLLGLFFMSIGMSVDLQVILQQFPLIIYSAIALMLIKACIIIILCKILGFNNSISLQSGLILSQGGEFTFILFNLAADHKFMERDFSQLLMIIVTVSMALTPFAAGLGRFAASKLEKRRRRKAEDSIEEIIDITNHVIILGFGRVGQTIAKLLSAKNINYIALDMQISTVAQAKKNGMPVYYGDSTRRKVLHAIGVERAIAAIVTINEPIAAENAVRTVREYSSTIPIVARGLDIKRVQSLEAAGANIAISEMFETSLQLGGALLKSIGTNDQEIMRIIEVFRDKDYALARGTLE